MDRTLSDTFDSIFEPGSRSQSPISRRTPLRNGGNRSPGTRRLCHVCLSGQTAAKFEKVLALLGYETVVLPSTSPAYTLAFEAKLDRWRRALEH
jgi:G:T/U-mismatch repair DNA glycosylase